MRRGFLLIAVALALLSHCSANITTSSGIREGYIKNSTYEHLIIEDGSKIEKIRHDDIKDIDHPGNGLMAYGLISVSIGTIMLLNKRENFAEYVGFSFLGGSLIFSGIIYGLAGTIIYARSYGAAKRPKLEKVGYHLLPNFRGQSLVAVSYRF